MELAALAVTIVVVWFVPHPWKATLGTIVVSPLFVVPHSPLHPWNTPVISIALSPNCIGIVGIGHRQADLWLSGLTGSQTRASLTAQFVDGGGCWVVVCCS